MPLCSHLIIICRVSFTLPELFLCHHTSVWFSAAEGLHYEVYFFKAKVSPRMVKKKQKRVSLAGWLCIGVWLTGCEAPPPAVSSPAAPTTAVAEKPVPQKVTLTLYFWYGCPHCFEFRHYLQPWLEDWSDKVMFSRVPIALRPDWIDHARAFYAALALGVAP